ncbi:MAG: hypothetical protein ABJI22_18755 [Maribacter sp.]
MRFSERFGYKSIKQELQFEVIDDDLRNSLWTVYLDTFIRGLKNINHKKILFEFTYSLWRDFLKLPIDNSPISSDGSVQKLLLTKYIRDLFFSDSGQWFEIYDLIEFSAIFSDIRYQERFNLIFEREKSGYRFLKGQIVPLTSKEEISEIEEAIENDDSFKSVKLHLETALKFLSDKQHPNYRNSIKESISSIESICKIFTGDKNSTLGQALGKLEKEGHLHPALKKAFSALYGYTSSDAGIRHALIEDDREIDFFEAKFMLATCSSFVNLVKSKMLE